VLVGLLVEHIALPANFALQSDLAAAEERCYSVQYKIEVVITLPCSRPSGGRRAVLVMLYLFNEGVP